jgi:hypothetical protein
MMFFEGNIAAPPTITVFSPDISLFILSCALTGATIVAVTASALNATAERSAIRLDMGISRWIELTGGFAGDCVNDRGGSICPTAPSLSELRELLGAVSENNLS